MEYKNKLIGYRKLFNDFLELYHKNLLPNKLLLNGKRGIGKFIFTYHFINYICSQNEEYKYNLEDNLIDDRNKSYQLFKKNVHPNIFLIKKKEESKFIEISQIRDMIKFQNSSSFNNEIKFIIIDNISDLNLNSSNALLKSIEEPNNKVFYILTYNTGSFLLDTIKSRCIEFKIFLKQSSQKKIINDHFSNDIYDSISADLVNFYSNPSFLISLINYLNEQSLNYNSATIENVINLIIKNRDYTKNIFIKENINFFIELFFYKNINLTNKINYNLKKYFFLKLSQVKQYNLDMESYFIEFQEKLLSE